MLKHSLNTSLAVYNMRSKLDILLEYFVRFLMGLTLYTLSTSVAMLGTTESENVLKITKGYKIFKRNIEYSSTSNKFSFEACTVMKNMLRVITLLKSTAKKLLISL